MLNFGRLVGALLMLLYGSAAFSSVESGVVSEVSNCSLSSAQNDFRKYHIIRMSGGDVYHFPVGVDSIFTPTTAPYYDGDADGMFKIMFSLVMHSFLNESPVTLYLGPNSRTYCGEYMGLEIIGISISKE